MDDNSGLYMILKWRFRLTSSKGGRLSYRLWFSFIVYCQVEKCSSRFLWSSWMQYCISVTKCALTLLSSAGRLALNKIGWSRTDRKSCFPMSLTYSSSSCDRNKYASNEVLFDKSHRRSRESIPWRGWSTVSIFRHIKFYFLFRKVDDYVRDIRKHDFRSILLHDMLSNGNLFRDLFFLFFRFVRFLTSQANRSG